MVWLQFVGELSITVSCKKGKTDFGRPLVTLDDGCLNLMQQELCVKCLHYTL